MTEPASPQTGGMLDTDATSLLRNLQAPSLTAVGDLEAAKLADALNASTRTLLATLRSLTPPSPQEERVGTLLLGGSGNDNWTTSGFFADTVFAGLGNDSIGGSGGQDQLYGEDGNDRLDGGAYDDTLDGGNGNDSLLGGADADLLDGGVGNDTLAGGLGDDVFYVDQTRLGATGDLVVEAANAGYDQVFATAAAYVLTANVEALTYEGAASFHGTGNGIDNRIAGGAQNDTLSGLAGNDILFGNEGADSLQGGAGNDTIVGGAGADLIDAGAGQDWIEYAGVLDGGDTLGGGGVGPDRIVNFQPQDGDRIDVTQLLLDNGVSLSLADSLRADYVRVIADPLGGGFLLQVDADGGDDSFVTLANISGGTAAAPLTLERVGAAIIAGSVRRIGGTGNDSLLGGMGDDVIDGAGGHDTLLGNGGADTLLGGLGNDRLDAGAGADYLDGGLGNDILLGGGGADTMIGGFGNDAYHVDDAGDVVIEGDFLGGNDTLFTSVSQDISTGSDQFIDHVIASGYDDLTLTGNGLVNALVGNAGANTIAGGFGRDTLTGGGGADIFVYGLGDSLTAASEGGDQILDFSIAQGDRLDVTALLADFGMAGRSLSSLIADGYFTNTIRASANIIFDTNGAALPGGGILLASLIGVRGAGLNLLDVLRVTPPPPAPLLEEDPAFAGL